MTPLMQLMKLQGDLRTLFINLGIETGKAGELAAEAIHLMLTSDIMPKELVEAYDNLGPNDDNK